MAGHRAGKAARAAVALTLASGLCWPLGLAAADADKNVRAAVVAEDSNEDEAESIQIIDVRPAVVEADSAEVSYEADSNALADMQDSSDAVIVEANEVDDVDSVDDPDVSAGEPTGDEPAATEPTDDPVDESDDPTIADGDAGSEAADETLQPSKRYDTEAILEAAREAGVAGIDALERYLSDEELSDDELLSIDAEALADIDEGLAAEIAVLQDEARARIESTESEQADVAATDAEDAQAAGSEAATLLAGASDLAAGEEAESEKESASKLEAALPEEIVEAAGDTESYPEWSYDGDTTLTSTDIIQNLTTRKFVALVGEQARELAAENDLYASVMIAQAILESGSGNSKLAQAPNFNLFGIKGAYNGQSVTMATQEDDGTGHYYTVDAAFRRYPSYRESLEDYADLLSRPYYLSAHKSTTSDYAEACSYLQGTYATSTGYAAVLANIVETYDLTRYDEPLDYELVGSYEAVVDPRTGEQLGVGSDAVAAWSQVMADEEQEGVPVGERSAVVEQRGLGDLAAQAMGQLGCDYVWGATGPDAFDCSGLVQSSYAEALGFELPRTTHYQCIVGEDVDFADLHTGDLVFFANEKNVVYHVGMYLGEGCYIESTVPGGVQVTAMEENMPTFAKRVLPTRDVLDEEPVLEEQVEVAPEELLVQARDVVRSTAYRFGGIVEVRA